ncbi:MAG: hypothetical protein JNM93_05005 [Bacteriovoracaceae bacterium]|nr:hypothetical protein [Bacteriovoracaceae bacterium]
MKLLITLLALTNVAYAAKEWRCSSNCVYLDTVKEKKPFVMGTAKGTSVAGAEEAYDLMMDDCRTIAGINNKDISNVYILNSLSFSRDDSQHVARSNSHESSTYRSGAASLILLYGRRSSGYSSGSSHSYEKTESDTFAADMDFASAYDGKTCREVEVNPKAPRKILSNGTKLQG